MRLPTFLFASLALFLAALAVRAQYPPVADLGIARAVDLNLGESSEVRLSDGSLATVKLIALKETRDTLRQAVREARVTVEINGKSVSLVSAMYHLPIAAAGVQVDCPITRGLVEMSSEGNVWALHKDARLRIWPAKSPW